MRPFSLIINLFFYNMSRLATLKNMLLQSPNDAFLLFAIAKEYEKQNLEQAALAHYQQLTKANPDYVGVYYHLGKWYERAQNLAAAFATYQKGMTIAKVQNDQHAYNELAAAKLNLGDDDDFL